MAGVCARPGCCRIAAAAIAVDPKHLTVWIGDLETSDPSASALCAVHVAGLKAPVGWCQRDLRDTPKLFVVPTTGDDAPVRRTGRRRRNDNPSPAAPTLEVTPEATSAPDAVPETTVAAAATAPETTTPTTRRRRSALPAGRPADRFNPLLAELHRARTSLSAETEAMLEVGADSPLLARAFRASRAAG